MPSGGRRPGAGRTPELGSIREAGRAAEGVLRTLPREYTGPVPNWPLTRASARELAVWRSIWTKPQATIWAEESAEDRVAMYVRTFVEAESKGVSSAVRSLMLRQENALLLTHATLLSAGFRITKNADANAGGLMTATTTAAKRRAVPSSRGRLRAVDPPPD